MTEVQNKVDAIVDGLIEAVYESIQEPMSVVSAHDVVSQLIDDLRVVRDGLQPAYDKALADGDF